MSHTVAAVLEPYRAGPVHYWAQCWRIARSDGTVLRFTDHDVRLQVATGTIDSTTLETFLPAGGFRATAEQGQGQLGDRNFEAEGILTSSYITDDDIRAGRYREAEVKVYLVDYRYPWMGYLRYARFWIDDLAWSAEAWRAQVVGQTRLLRRPLGRIHAKACDAALGDTRCGVNLASLTVAGKQIAGITTQRLVFTCTMTSLSSAAGYYDQGKVTWTSGSNSGVVSEIESWEKDTPAAGTGRVSLWLATPFDLAVNDQFSIAPGCDKASSTCGTKFSNRVNFRGFPFVPGNDDLLETPW